MDALLYLPVATRWVTRLRRHVLSRRTYFLLTVRTARVLRNPVAVHG
jgi:hypothetical protein